MKLQKKENDMARLKNRTTAKYFEKDKYVKDGLNCWTKSGADFECKVECPYNERKGECDCHTAVSKDALDYINKLETKLADVVPKSEAEKLCEINSLLTEAGQEWQKRYENLAREIFEEIEEALFNNHDLDLHSDYPTPHYYEELKDDIAELRKKYVVEIPIIRDLAEEAIDRDVQNYLAK